MPDVGRQRQHRLIDIDVLCLPLHDAPDDEGMPQVVDARRMVSTPIGPPQLPAQLGEDAMHLTVAQALPTQLSPGVDEERTVIVVGVACQIALRTISSQGVQRARMHGYLTGLAELG